jgi:uncharacterized membrane protein
VRNTVKLYLRPDELEAKAHNVEPTGKKKWRAEGAEIFLSVFGVLVCAAHHSSRKVKVLLYNFGGIMYLIFNCISKPQGRYREVGSEGSGTANPRADEQIAS